MADSGNTLPHACNREPACHSLGQAYLSSWADFIRQIPADLKADFEAEKETFLTLWGFSDFCRQLCLRHGDRVAGLWRQELLKRGLSIQDYRALVDAAVQGHGLAAGLRRQRQLQSFRLAWRDLLGLCGVQQTCFELSLVAEALIGRAQQELLAELIQKHGVPRNRRGEPQGFAVIAMGKLGAYELNFSSDVDLIFVYADDGETDGDKPLSNQVFFQRLGQRLISVLNDQSADGFVYRVDMRLRPYGDSGPLVMSLAAMEDYYQTQGRDWERYAMIKARTVAGDMELGRLWLQRLRPFVYRRYLDYSTINGLRQMKQMIADQVSRKGMEHNIKLGSGGIREIEFVVQTFQLIRGGRQPVLRQRQVLLVLDALEQLQCLPDFAVSQLRQAYLFLRKLENSLQAFADQQTHDLPVQEQPLQRLACIMGYAQVAKFQQSLNTHRRHVSEHFEQVFAAPQTEAEDETQMQWQQLWRDLKSDQSALVLSTHGYDLTRSLPYLIQIQNAAFYHRLPQQGRQRFDQLMPLFLAAVAGRDNSSELLQRSFPVLQSIAGRTTYLALLVENPLALSQLIKLCEASLTIAESIARHPMLLDELMDPRRLYEPLHKAELELEYRRALANVQEDDLEQQMETLRRLKHAHALRVAAADVTEVLPLMRVSDYLTDIAEVVLQHTLELTSRSLEAVHGVPRYDLDGRSHACGFIIVAYGKLGGIELGYGSDLDLVFLHDSQGERQQTDGGRVMDNGAFFARLAQKLMHMLNAHMQGGILYEVDVRLRPNGNAGLLVSSLQSFEQYQLHKAWTWEHQALVRARAVAGTESLVRAFSRIRREILCQPRDSERLKTDVMQMRAKLKQAHVPEKTAGGEGSQSFDLKFGYGGITDIEFINQYLVLRWAHQHEEMAQWTDNIRIMETAERLGLLEAGDAAELTRVYKTYRAQAHRLALNARKAQTDAGMFAECRRQVESIWQKVVESG